LIGKCYYRQRKYEDALLAYTHEQESNLNQAELADCYFGLNQFEESRKICEKALEKNQENADLLKIMGLSLCKLSRVEEGIETLELSSVINPKYLEVVLKAKAD